MRPTEYPIQNAFASAPIRFASYRKPEMDHASAGLGGTMYKGDEQGVYFTLLGRALPKGQTMFLQYRIDNQAERAEAMQWNAKRTQWELKKPINNDSVVYYRFFNPQTQQYIYDNTQVKDIEGINYNVIPAKSADPQSHGAGLLAMQDSVIPGADSIHIKNNPLKTALSRGMPYSHFTTYHKAPPSYYNPKTQHIEWPDNPASYQFNGKVYAGNPYEALNKVYHDAGMSFVEFRPLIGGDNLGAHRYWTTSLWQLNQTVPTVQSFEDMVKNNFKHGIGTYLDGAFVNEGLNGVHYLSNMYYGKQSPYMDWFNYGSFNAFPDKRLQLGILPDAKPGDAVDPAVGDTRHWDIRFLDRTGSVIAKKGVLTDKPGIPGPYYVELYDPTRENDDGTPVKGAAKPWDAPTSSRDSVQNYKFPITQAEFEKKIDAMRDAGMGNGVDVLSLKRRWEKFEFTTSQFDNSGYKWNGQRDVNKLMVTRPEVQDYIVESCTYWQEKVDKIQIETVGNALGQVLHPHQGNQDKNSQPTALLAGIHTLTQKGILPSLHGQPEPYNVHSIQKALDNYAKEKATQSTDAAALLTNNFKQHFSLATLPVPVMLQVLLNTPQLKETLVMGRSRFLFAVIQKSLSPLSFLLIPGQKLMTRLDKWFPNKKPGTWISTQAQKWLGTLPFLYQTSFFNRAQSKFSNAFQQLPQVIQQKLQEPILSRQIYEDLGRSLFLSLLTGQFIAPDQKVLNPQDMGRMIYQHLPAEITMASPQEGVKLLNKYLMRQLKTFDFNQFNPYLTHALKDITPEAAVTARHVIHQRRLGLNWRIDAALDLGDMNIVHDATDPELREVLVKGEVAQAKAILNQFSQGVRSVYPHSIIKAEVDFTHFPQDLRLPLFQQLMAGDPKSNNRLNGAPNYNWFYASGLRAVHALNDMGETKYTGPAEYIQKTLKPMMGSLPLEQTMRFQNMTSNHDKPTTLQGLLYHPRQAGFDEYTWWNLIEPDGSQNKGIIPFALNELRHKQNRLGFFNLGDIPRDKDNNNDAYGKIENALLQDATLLNRLYANPDLAPALPFIRSVEGKTRKPINDRTGPISPAEQNKIIDEELFANNDDNKTDIDFLPLQAAHVPTLKTLLKAAIQDHPYPFNLDKTELKQQYIDWLFEKLPANAMPGVDLTTVRNIVKVYKTGNYNLSPIGAEAKKQFMEALFAQLTPQKLGIHSAQFKRLQTALTGLVLEPSEVKAVRGQVSNVAHALAKESNPFPHSTISAAQGHRIMKALAPALDESLWTLGQHYKQWFGHLQLDYVIDWAVQHAVDSSANKALKAAVGNHPETIRQIKQAIFNTMMAPALEKFKRIAAIQVAVPGDPTFYLADLLGQAGGEGLRNMFVQNRNLARHDRINQSDIYNFNPVLKQHFDEVNEIIRQRQTIPVLNNGQLELPLDPFRAVHNSNNNFDNLDKGNAEYLALEKFRILPLMRDNGTDKCLCLINFANDSELSDWNTWAGKEAQKSEAYPELKDSDANKQNHTVKDYKLNLSYLGIPVGTRYKVVGPEGSGEIYIALKGKDDNDKPGVYLVNENNHNKGIDIHIAKTLMQLPNSGLKG